MSQSSPNNIPQIAGAQSTVEALAALQAYDAGSSRGSLCPLDDAAKRAVTDRNARAQIEGSLLTVLKRKPSPVAVEYICSKLALVGSGACVPTLVDFLGRPETSLAARNALEKIPGGSASEALRKSLPRLGRAETIGVTQSLAAREDAASVTIIAQLLKDADSEVAVAAAAALGQFGSTKAAKALKQALSSALQPLRSAAADAALACAERLMTGGHPAEARSLYQALAAPGQPPHVQKAAARGLETCASRRSQRPGT